MNLQPLTALGQKLQATVNAPPGGDVLFAAAQKAAAETEELFRARKVPIRVLVTRQGNAKVTVRLVATRRLSNSFVGRTPMGVLRQVLDRHLATAKYQVAAELERNLR